MDEINKESKLKNNFINKISSSIFKIVPNILSKSINIDLNESEKINLTKENYKNSLLQKFKNEKNKRILEKDEIDDRFVFKRVKINDLSIKNEQNDFSESSKLNFSYRGSIFNTENQFSRDLNRSTLIRIDSNQSLNDSMEGGYQGATASRIYANIFTQKSVNFTEPESKNCVTNPSVIYPRNRRFKTVIKRDRISKYLQRETVNEDELFNSPTAAPLSFKLSVKNDDSSKRYNLSELRKITENLESRKMEYWSCEECMTKNPINFNFCPTCSNPNPINKVNSKHSNISVPLEILENTWRCLRCSTVNDEKKDFCVFCFLGKNNSYVVPSNLSNIDSHMSLDESNSSVLHSKIRDSVNSRISKLFETDVFPTNEPCSKWRCSTCMVENDLDKQVCVCCCTKNPTKLLNINYDIQTANKIISNASNKWRCLTCMIENDYTTESCVCCKTKNTNINQNSICLDNKVERLPKIHFGINTETLKFNLSKSNKWICPMCMVDNDNEKQECCCCMTRNPTESKQNFVFGKKIEETPTIKFGCATKINPISEIKFGCQDTSKLSETWNCPTCLVQNDSYQSSCVCCETKNPNFTIISTSFDISFGKKLDTVTQIKFGNDSNKMTNGIWNCPECFAPNDFQQSVCLCCQTKNPIESEKILPLETFSFGKKSDTVTQIKFGNDASEMSKSTWDCPTCLVQNDSKQSSCVCCQTKNPIGLVKSTPSDKISFGIKSDTVPTMKFGSDASEISNYTWDCPTCLVQNNSKQSSCVCCQTKNPISPDKLTLLENISFGMKSNNVTQIKLGSDNNKSSICKWNCPTCMVDNSTQLEVCACCNTQNPGCPLAFNGTLHSKSLNIDYQSKPDFEFGTENKSKLALHFFNGKDKIARSSLGIKRDSNTDLIPFSFSKPIVVDSKNLVDLDNDMEFEFSKAGVI